jgi:imidazolonepropionase-like amidohydrolase
MATYFANISVFDGRSLKTKAGVLVANGTISWVGAHARAPREAAAAHEVDGSGRTLAPGLIDCHVHLCFEGSADLEAEARRMTNDAVAAVKAVRNAARHLERGVTTVRDLGGPGHATIEVARAVEAGLVPGPRVLAAGRALTITGGHGHTIGLAREVDGPDAVRRAVREEIRAGASVVKIIATGGVLTPGSTAEFAAFTPEELEAAVGESHAWGRAIAAHAHGAAGILNAVRAGVDSIEHGSMLSPEAARLMKERGTFHVPTLSAFHGILQHADEVPAYAVEKTVALEGEARDAFRRALRAGVSIACGTDAGTPFNPHGGAPVEVVRMVEWGMTPLRAMQAATSVGADLLRLPEVGTIEPGKAADLVLLDADPIEEIDAVLKPAMVMKAGEVAAGADL